VHFAPAHRKGHFIESFTSFAASHITSTQVDYFDSRITQECPYSLAMSDVFMRKRQCHFEPLLLVATSRIGYPWK
jgi:hypothetical protein